MPVFPCPQCQNPLDPPPGLGGLYIACPCCGFHVPVPDGPFSDFALSPTALPPEPRVAVPNLTDPALLRELPDPLPAEVAALGPPVAVFQAPRPWWQPWSGDAHLIVCAAGFVVQRQQFEVYRWDQVRWAEQRATRLTSARYFSIHCDNGRRFDFDDRWDRVEVLGPILLHQTTTAVLRRAFADHDAGRALDFGVFQIDAAGVRRGKERLPWNRARVVQHSKERVWVWQWDQEKPWAQVAAGEIAHPTVFVALVNGIIAGLQDSLR